MDLDVAMGTRPKVEEQHASVRHRSDLGAGATITKDVPAGALALSRQPQKNIEGWVERRAKKSKKK